MALTPTVSVAGQAFPAVVAPQSVVEFATPSTIQVASQPLARPSDVNYSPVPILPNVNVQDQSLLTPNRPEYLVLPNRKQNLPQNDPISPIVLQIIAWPAPNRIQVRQVQGGIVLPPLNAGQSPTGVAPTTRVLDLTAQAISFLGRQILMVDNPNYLTPEPYFTVLFGTVPVNNIGGLPTAPSLLIPAENFAEADNAFILGISGTDTLILTKIFNSDPTGAWLIIDQRIGFEAETNYFQFQGTYTPDPFLPYPFPENAPLNLDGGTYRPQFAESIPFAPSPPQALPPVPAGISPSTIANPFIPSPPQALPPILQTVQPNNQAFDGLPQNFFQ